MRCVPTGAPRQRAAFRWVRVPAAVEPPLPTSRHVKLELLLHPDQAKSKRSRLEDAESGWLSLAPSMLAR